MKLGLLPLFKPESFGPNGLSASALEYFSAHALAEIIGYVESNFPQLQIVVQLALNQMLQSKPDLVLLWATSPCFGQVEPIAESLKIYLDIPVWLAGPHISYLPQSLPDHVDIGILGEAELPLQQLLSIWLKQPDAGAMQYRRVPGIIYQSRGRIYSGQPAQIVPQLSQLPQPNFRRFLDLPGFSAPVVRSARCSDNIFTALAFPPSRKVRLQHPEHLCQQIQQIAENYVYLYRQLPIPKEHLHVLSPVFIPDYQFVLHRQRLEAFVKLYRERGLHQRVFLMPCLPPEAANPEVFELLKSLNTRKVLLQLGPLDHQNPLIPAWTPEQLEKLFTLCQRYHIGVLGTLYLNPDVGTTRRQLAQTYLVYRDLIHRFEKLQISAMGLYPGAPAWEQYMAKVKPDSTALAAFPWSSLDWEKLTPNLPLYHTSLDRYSLQEIDQAFRSLSLENAQTVPPMTEDLFDQARQQMVGQFLAQYWSPGQRILEVPLWPENALKPLLPGMDIDQLKIHLGRLVGPTPPEKADLIVLSGSVTALRDPQAALNQLKTMLKPDGRILIHWMNPQNLGNLLGFWRWDVSQSKASNQMLKFIKIEEMAAMLARSGMEVIKTDYNVMDQVEWVRPTVETLAARLEYHASLRIPQHLLYVSEIKMLARNRS